MPERANETPIPTPPTDAAPVAEATSDMAEAAPAGAGTAATGKPAPRPTRRRATAAKTTTAQTEPAEPAEPTAKPAAPEPAKAAPPFVRSPELYLNRELTWLEFNRRVLAEARDTGNPPLERLKFLAIVSSNLDEFFMKRVGGLMQLIGAGVHERTVDGRSPRQQLAECGAVIQGLYREKREVFLDLVAVLRGEGVVLANHDDLSDAERAAMRDHYIENIFPLVTPLAMDPAHPFPHISNLSLNLLVSLHHPDELETLLARVKVPLGAGVPRFLRIGEGNRFVRLEEVMAANLDLLFPGMTVRACELFRVTRNANTERDEDQADDLLAMIESELRDRKFAPIVRLQTQAGINPVHRGMLAAELGLDEARDVHEVDVMLGMRDLMEIATLDIPSLRDAPHHPINNVKLQDARNIFHIIRENGPILLHHPYESFGTSVERFVREASTDPKVRAIKMTLYRTSAGTKIIDYLVDAARNGKQVAVAIELKARFDEAANIRWASRLEEFGIHVTYGVIGLKTHAKAILVVRGDYNGLRRYAHLGTGNYHAGTARLYCDLGMLTCDPDIGHDLTELFNYLTTGCKPSRKYAKALVAPKQLKKGLLARIDREIAAHSADNPGLIRFKTNALEDADITDALYRASAAGVRVELVVRDTCRLRPGVPGLSETITVTSIIGRFLEHARIYYFQNGGDEEFFIGSADLMTRNLESRVEVLAPVEEAGPREELRALLDAQIADRHCAWRLAGDGRYTRPAPAADDPTPCCQQLMIDRADRRNFEANRLRRRRPLVVARRSNR